jgi:hypothetical protein
LGGRLLNWVTRLFRKGCSSALTCPAPHAKCDTHGRERRTAFSRKINDPVFGGGFPFPAEVIASIHEHINVWIDSPFVVVIPQR